MVASMVAAIRADIDRADRAVGGSFVENTAKWISKHETLITVLASTIISSVGTIHFGGAILSIDFAVEILLSTGLSWILGKASREFSYFFVPIVLMVGKIDKWFSSFFFNNNISVDSNEQAIRTICSNRLFRLITSITRIALVALWWLSSFMVAVPLFIIDQPEVVVCGSIFSSAVIASIGTFFLKRHWAPASLVDAYRQRIRDERARRRWEELRNAVQGQDIDPNIVAMMRLIIKKYMEAYPSDTKAGQEFATSKDCVSEPFLSIVARELPFSIFSNNILLEVEDCADAYCVLTKPEHGEELRRVHQEFNCLSQSSRKKIFKCIHLSKEEINNMNEEELRVWQDMRAVASRNISNSFFIAYLQSALS